MKFLSLYCTARKADVSVNPDKIVLVSKIAADKCRIDLSGNAATVEVDIPFNELLRKISGEDREGIGFRRNA